MHLVMFGVVANSWHIVAEMRVKIATSLTRNKIPLHVIERIKRTNRKVELNAIDNTGTIKIYIVQEIEPLQGLD